MARDPYQPCPCGSGNKLKFCCFELADEMDRISSMQSKNQTRQAIQHLAKLESTHPENAWVKTSHAALLMSDGHFEEARDSIRDFSEANPDHAFALAILASTSIATEGYQASRRVLHRALQKSTGAFPDFMSNVVAGVAAIMFNLDCHMACRQFMTIALRLAREEARQQIFVRLLEFESDQDIPYPLRSVHELSGRPDGLSEDDQKEFVRATRLSDMGCFGPAAKLFARLTDRHPECGQLWHNIGLCRAWDGDHAAATEALHKASGLLEDEALATECETIAQLFDLDLTDDFVAYCDRGFDVDSIAKALTQLDDHEYFHRIPQPAQADERLVASFEISDRPVTDETPIDDWSTSDVPLVRGHFAFFDADREAGLPAEAFVSALEGESLDNCLELIQETLGDSVSLRADEESERDRTVVPRELIELQWRWHFPGKAPGKLRRALEQSQWHHMVYDQWPQQQLSSLGDRSPQEAAGDPESRTQTLAAVYVLDAFSNRNGFPLDTDRILEMLGLESLPQIEPTEDLSIGGMSAMQINRLPVEKLSDDQLTYTMNRALLVHHRRFLKEVLSAVLERPACLESIDEQRVYRTLTDLDLDHFDIPAALEWISKGAESSGEGPSGFERKLSWKLRELMVRLEDPEDGQIQKLVDELWNYYGTKIPELRAELTNILSAYGRSVPGIDLGGAAAADAGGPLWTPGASEAAPSEGEQKLWIPGQNS